MRTCWWERGFSVELTPFISWKGTCDARWKIAKQKWSSFIAKTINLIFLRFPIINRIFNCLWLIPLNIKMSWLEMAISCLSFFYLLNKVIFLFCILQKNCAGVSCDPHDFQVWALLILGILIFLRNISENFFELNCWLT